MFGLKRIEKKLDTIILILRNLETTLMSTVKDLQDAIAANTTVTASIATLVNGIADNIKNLVDNANANVPGLDEAIAELKANTEALSNAVVAGTAAESLLHPAGAAVVETPVVETPVDQTPVVETPVVETPVDQTDLAS